MGLESTSTPPTTVSREEHTSLTSSTPQSFGDIPPVLRFEDEVEVTLSQGEGSSSVHIDGRVGGKLWVTERYVSPTSLISVIAEGELTYREVVFIPSGGHGFKLNYQSLTLHALTPASGDLEAHLYCQIDDSDESAVGAGGDDDEYGEMRELRVFIGDSKCTFTLNISIHSLRIYHQACNGMKELCDHNDVDGIRHRNRKSHEDKD